jgi:hypothetical protein
MFAFFCLILSIGLAALGRAKGSPPEAVYSWLAALLATFWVLRTARQKFIEAREVKSFDELCDSYLGQFGTTSSGLEFIEQCLPWRQRRDSSLGLLSLFGDWHDAGARRIAAAAGAHVSAKTMEQRMLEDAIRSITKVNAKHRRNFSRAIWLTSIATVGVGAATQTQILSPPIGRPPVPVPVQYASVEEAHRVAISRHPKLAILGSKLNRAFIARAHFYRETRPGYFRDNSWPIRLADTLAAMPLARS